MVIIKCTLFLFVVSSPWGRVKCIITFVIRDIFNYRHVKQNINNNQVEQNNTVSLEPDPQGGEGERVRRLQLNGWMVVLTLGRRERKKKTATKEQNSLAASLRTCSSFSWSEYSHCAAATAAQTGTQRPYDREIKQSAGKSTQGGTESRVLFVLLNYPARGTFHTRKLSVMNVCQRRSDMVDLSNMA